MKIWSIFIIFLVCISACKKDKIPIAPLPEQPTKWEIISGDYKVYDTLGVFLYDMSINYTYNTSGNQHILSFANFDSQFEINSVQSLSSLDPEFLIIYGYHALLYDSLGKRWKIYSSIEGEYNNVLVNDTIRMNFQKTNINYYLSDWVPYYACNCKQIAVKQD